MDLFRKRHIVEGLTMLIEANLDNIENEKSAPEKYSRAGIARDALNIAERLDYFPEPEFRRMTEAYQSKHLQEVLKTH